MSKIPKWVDDSPQNINGLEAWYDATNLTGADGSSITQWLDISGNQAHLYQSTTAAQPTLQTNELNGQNIVRFDGVDDFMTMTAPLNAQPTNVSSANACAWSKNGNYLFHANSTTSPFHFLYKVNGNQFSKMSDLSPLTSMTAINGSAWSHDDLYLAVVGAGTNRLQIFKRSGDTFTKLTDPTQPGGTCFACDWYYDGSNYFLAVSGAGDRIFLYKNSGDTFNQLSAPTTLPAGTQSTYCQFSPNGNFIYVSANASPYLTFYIRSGDTFTKLNDPTTALTNSALSATWIDENNLVIAGTSLVPRLYSWDGTTFQQGIQVGTFSSSGNLSFDSSKTYLAIVTGSSPFMRLYKRSGTTYTALSIPASIPASTGRGVAWSPNGEYLAVSHLVSPFLQIYRREADNFVNLTRLNLLRNVTGATLFAVVKYPASVAINYSVLVGGATSTRASLVQSTSTKVATVGRSLDPDSVTTIAGTTTITNNFLIQTGVFDYANGDGFVYRNNILEASNLTAYTASNSSNTNSINAILGSTGAAGFLNGDIAEILIYIRALSTPEITRVNQYLSRKWGITLA